MIFEAIAAIKIANEAIGAIKQFAGHVESIGEMGKDLIKLADAKADLEKAKAEGDDQAFWELEKIKKHEAEVKTLFIYAGRPGLWDDYCKFIENRKCLREQEQKRIAQAKVRKKQLAKDWAIGIAVTIGALSAIGLAVYILYWIITTKGQ